MTVEKMRILLGLDSVGNEVTNNVHQQITPDNMSFTCNYTKCIIGTWWSQENDDTLYLVIPKSRATTMEGDW